MYLNECMWCGKEFYGTPDSDYCSEECGEAAAEAEFLDDDDLLPFGY